MYIPIILFGAIVSSNAFLESLFFRTESLCKPHEFVCNNGKCIPESKRCDSSNDCLDFSDEEDCDVYLCKEPRYFKCLNNRCISKSFVCDGENDCEDFSDEKDCANFKLTYESNQTCAKGEWQCKDKLCIAEEWVCNGEDDCLDGSDETIGCSLHIDCDGFKCNNGHCIPNEWVCDGNDDCIDNSDEKDCDLHVDLKQCTLDHDKFLCSDKKKCIDTRLVCDGKADCSDRSDESNNCAKGPNCTTLHCEHKCVLLPTGPKCICPKGYNTVDEKHCEDINECEIYGICDQKCRNTDGSYECYCDDRYTLDSDKKTCIANGGEAMMVFSSKTEIRAITLKTEIYFPIAKNLKQVVGVKYDGHHIYWTDIFSEHESIVRSIEDGSERELLITAGLGLPEDLAIDWVTGNIYFTDAEKKHIGVCSNDGSHCTVLVNSDIEKPRAICLNIAEGEMYWTDWGHTAKIAVSSMDGSKDRPFVTNNIHWPNGITLDEPNGRIYWTDAKILTLESIRLDGTDRRVILKDVIKHPYAIAVFEDRIFWSDWATHSIQYCNKFTGKNHTTLVKENREFIYGLSIYHSAMRSRMDNPCSMSFCSDICLLSGKGYKCACGQNRQLSSDKHSCKPTKRTQMLILGARDVLVSIEHQTLGKHDISELISDVKNVGALAYNSITNTLYVSDLSIKKIVAINLVDREKTVMSIDGLGKITCMDFDNLGNNLYICDEERGAVEVINLSTMTSTVILHDLNGEIPESIALVPEEGVMFISFKRSQYRTSHIDRLLMDGTGRTHAIDSGLIGPVRLTFDYGYYRVFWTDAGTGKIESTSVDGDDRHGFRSLSSSPISIATTDVDIFWVNQFSRRVYWAARNATTTANKKITLDIPDDVEYLHIISASPKTVGTSSCRLNNGNCSHICLLSHKSYTCACPVGMSLGTDHKTCITRAHCDSKEFMCHQSNKCILNSLVCNGHNDCPLGEDEIDCLKPHHCTLGQFQCNNGQCISEHLRCDSQYDCTDRSDENNCTGIVQKCPPDQFSCDNGNCIANRFICDGVQDCLDASDERSCPSASCEANQFRCNSGSCIPKSWECDHEFDCVDFSDEHSGCASLTCAPHMFTCTNGKCIDSKLVCDNSDNCGDNSDEELCLQPELACGLDGFACASNTSICLPNAARCNGTSECPQHEDEKNCSNCNVDEFSCKNGKCISVQWTCDKIDDCGDNSDEAPEMCKDHPEFASHAIHVHCDNGFRCKSGDCIDPKLVCNGKHDCYDGSDENGLCSKSCTGNLNPCSQECVKTPQGPTCKCRDGFQLMGDSRTCSDINECNLDPPVCSQLCHNNDGDYNCDCFDGFILRPDKKSCKAIGSPMSMVYASYNQLRMLSQQSNSLNIIYADETPKITGLDLTVDQYVYFSIETAGTIHRINTVTKKREYMEHIGQPQKLAVDWATNNVYYVNAESESRAISVCNFDKKMCNTLINTDVHRQVSAIAVDSLNKYLFYSITSWWIFNSPSFIIYKTNLDGTGKQELVPSTPGFITGLTYDLNKKVLYYVDQRNNQIRSINYDGTKNTAVFSNLTHPVSIKFFENHIYYSSQGGFMSKCQLFEKRTCDTHKLQSQSIDLFALNQKSLQPNVEDACRNNTCTYLCVPGVARYKCVCSDGTFVSPMEKCLNKEVDSSYHKVHAVQMQDNGKSKSHAGAIVTAVLVPLCLIAFGFCIYVLVKRRNMDNFNISIRFHNPGYGQGDDWDKAILKPGQHEYVNPQCPATGMKDLDNEI